MAPIVFIVGPTASGKSALAMRLALEHNGEIICADSQTIRKGMTIGTAKPSAADQAAVRHHLLDVIEPYGSYSAAQFKQAAQAAVADIKSRAKLPIIVGGTGLYIDSLYYDLPMRTVIDTNDYSEKTVQQLQDLITKKGLPMPVSSQNKRHLLNVLKTGQIRSSDKVVPAYASSCIVGLSPVKEVLQQRITARVHTMIKQGFVGEVAQLLATYGVSSGGFDAPAYNIIASHIAGHISLARAEELIVISDRQYAKRQLTWFRRNKHIVWFDSELPAYNFVQSSITS